MSITSVLDLGVYHALRDRTIEAIGTGTHRAVSHAVREGAAYARTHHEHKTRTGFLTNPHQLYGLMLKRDAKSAEGEIVNTAPYVLFVEQATKAHWIRPKAAFGFIGPMQQGQSRRARTDIGTHRVALRWYRNGRPVFATAVFHPGTPAMPFMFPAAEYAVDLAISLLENRFDDIGRMWS